jgi:hypothetical protein
VREQGGRVSGQATLYPFKLFAIESEKLHQFAAPKPTCILCCEREQLTLTGDLGKG